MTHNRNISYHPEKKMRTYLREVAHCSPSKYVGEVTIKEIFPAENSDHLEVVKFEELEWRTLVKIEDGYKVGNKVYFVPTESVLPFEVSERLGITKYLSRGLVRAVRLRGNISEGFIVPKEDIENDLQYIMKWEDLPTSAMGGTVRRLSEHPRSLKFDTFYKMPNIFDEPKIFSPGDKIFISEKIHGTSCRFGVFENPDTGEFEHYYGSHNLVLQNDAKCVYTEVIQKLLEKHKEIVLPKDIAFYGEIYGPKIQHLSYNLKFPTVKVFAAFRDDKYLTVQETCELCDSIGLPRVKFHEMVFTSIDDLRKIANEPSSIAENHIREGIVIRDFYDGGKMAKLISETYRFSKGKKTERH